VRGLRVTVLGRTSPVPDKVTVCKAEGLLSLTVMYPLRDPAAEGANVIAIVQLAPAASTFPQVLVWAKSPLATTLKICSGVLLEFINVTVWWLLVVFNSWLPNPRLEGDTETPTTAFTVRVVEPVTPADVALTVVVPVPALVANPWLPEALLIFATLVLDELHVVNVVRFCAVPSLKVPMTMNCW